ncbi:MAG: DUF3426 domain-containing protein [Comamonas sp.]|uniref:DUF3426 domain-containing protein n=1 Tax=Comamonas sp. TaxID=34028 RepID=UPI002FCA11B2
MSQVTRCPSCGTRFKVVADQLRISQGWVRCGRCQSVFDASQDLQTVSDELLEPKAQQPAVQAPAEQQESVQKQDAAEASNAPVLEASSADEERAVASYDSILASEEAQDVESAEVDAALEQAAEIDDQEAAQVPPESPAAPEPESDSSPEAAEEQEAAEPSFVDQARPLVADDESQVESVQAEQDKSPLAPESDPDAQEDAAVEVVSADALLSTHVDEPKLVAAVSLPVDADAKKGDGKDADEHGDEDEKSSSESDEPGFVREARRKAFWQSTGMRAVLVLGSLAAVAGVAGQYAWQQRDALAAQYPALTPVLTQACSLAGCELQARRQIADVVISGSGFKQLADAQQYQWSLTLENRSDFSVATPMAELTLTDAQDKPLLRRVIDLKPLGAPEQLQAHQEWSVSVSVQVQELDAPVAGYRALVFYP